MLWTLLAVALVGQLGHPRFAERERAGRLLDSLGTSALPALKAAASSTDPERRDRAAILVAGIERGDRSRRLLAAPTHALDFHRLTVPEAVERLAETTKLPVSYKTAGITRLVTLKTGDLKYWDAVAAFAEAAGLVEDDEAAFAGNNALDPGKDEAVKARLLRVRTDYGAQLGAGVAFKDGRGPTPADTRHAIRVRAVSADCRLNRFNAETDELTIHLDIDAAPSLPLAEFVGVEVRRVVAADGDASVSTLASPVADRLTRIARYPGPGPLPPPFRAVVLRIGPTRPTMLKSLEGVVTAKVLVNDTLATFADVDAEVGKSRGVDGFRATIERAVPGDGNRTLRINVEWSASAPADLEIPVQLKGNVRPFVRIRREGSATAYIPQLAFQGPDGKPRVVRQTRVTSTAMVGRGTMACEMEIQVAAARGEKLDLTMTGQRLVEVDMPFVLRDVPLPR